MSVNNKEMSNLPKPNIDNAIDISNVGVNEPGIHECITCGKKIKDNQKNITAHKKTKFHLDAVEGKSKKSEKTTAAQRQAEYRARKKSQLGEEKFKELQKEQKKKQRENKKKEEEKKQPEEVKQLSTELKQDYKQLVDKINDVIEKRIEIDPNTIHVGVGIAKGANQFIEKVQGEKDCDNLNKKMFEAVKRYNEKHPEKKKKLTLKSIQTYHKLLHRTYKRIYGKEMPDCSNFDWFRDDYTKVLKVILDQKQKLASHNTNIGHLAGYFSMLRDYQDVYQKLSLLSAQLSSKYQNQVKSGKKTEKQQERLIPLEELRSFEENLDEDNVTENLVYYLYGYKQLPRRSEDYSNMKIVKVKGKETKAKFISKLRNGTNYLLISRKSDEPDMFVFKSYKNKVQEILGEQVLEIDPSLKEALKKYIDVKDKKEGDYLFSKQRKNEPASNFSKFVSDSFKKITGKLLSINDLRHIFATYFNKQGLTIAQLEEIAAKMGQSSFTTLLSYNRADD